MLKRRRSIQKKTTRLNTHYMEREKKINFFGKLTSIRLDRNVTLRFFLRRIVVDELEDNDDVFVEIIVLLLLLLILVLLSFILSQLVAILLLLELELGVELEMVPEVLALLLLALLNMKLVGKFKISLKFAVAV